MVQILAFTVIDLRVVVAVIVVPILLLLPGLSSAAQTAWPAGRSYELKGLKVTVSAPVVLGRSQGEFWYPQVMRLAGGELLAIVRMEGDTVEGDEAGRAGFLWSADGGLTWSKRLNARGHSYSQVVLPSGDTVFLPYVLYPRPGGIGGPCNVVPKGKREVKMAGEVLVTGWPRELFANPSSFPEKLKKLNQAPFYFDGQPVKLKNGTFLATLYGHFAEEGDQKLVFDGSLFRAPGGQFKRFCVVAAKSADGVNWKICSIIADEKCKLKGGEGPCEPTLCRLADGRLMCVFRLDGGCGGGLDSYGQCWSCDEGLTWTDPVSMVGIGSVEPSLQVLKDGTVALFGGRPGDFLWLNSDGTAINWQAVDLLAHHNTLCQADAINTERDIYGKGASTSYGEVLALDDKHLLVVYDRTPLSMQGTSHNKPAANLADLRETFACYVVRVTVEKPANARSEKTKGRKAKMKIAPVIAANAVSVRMGEPVLVDQAPPGLPNGPYRMPKLYRLPTGEIGLTFSAGLDYLKDQGADSPLFASRDAGKTWKRSTFPHPKLKGMNPLIVPLYDGDYYCLPAGAGRAVDLTGVPQPLHTGISDSRPVRWYKLEDCPADTIEWFTDHQALRWSAKTQKWSEEATQWDHRNQIVEFIVEPGGKWWTQRLYIEVPFVRDGKELLHVDYWNGTRFGADGKPPVNTECELQVSSDNARSWTRRSRLVKSEKELGMYEPTLAMNKAGELVSVIRTDRGAWDPRPMLLVHSNDKGFTWSPPKLLFDRGVFPQLLQLDNGVLVLSFGRPGVLVSFSLDGGNSWTMPEAIIKGDPKVKTFKDTCGYTSLLALSEDEFLLAYSDYQRPNEQGDAAKAILVRHITVKPARKSFRSGIDKRRTK